MNNTTIINIFNHDNTISIVLTLNMTTITYVILKDESMIKKPIVANHAFFAAVTFSNINSFPYINSIVIQYLEYLIFKIIFIKIFCHLLVYSFISTVV